MGCKMENCGILYIAFGDFYLASTILSIETLKKTNNLPVTLVSNININIEEMVCWNSEIDKFIYVEAKDSENRKYKTNMINFARHKKNLFLDSDSLVLDDLSNLFMWLDFCDLVIRPYRKDRITGWVSGIPVTENGFSVRDFPHFNGGVIGFNRNQIAKEFFYNWNRRFLQSGLTIDQVSLVDAIVNTNIRILPISSDWNYHPGGRFYLGLDKQVKILHYLNRISPMITNEIIDISKNNSNINVDRVKTELNLRRRPYNKTPNLSFCILKLLMNISKVVNLENINNSNNKKDK